MAAHNRKPDTDDDVERVPLPRSLKVFLIVLGAIVLLIVVAHVMGRGLGGHS